MICSDLSVSIGSGWQADSLLLALKSAEQAHFPVAPELPELLAVAEEPNAAIHRTLELVPHRFGVEILGNLGIHCPRLVGRLVGSSASRAQNELDVMFEDRGSC